MEAKIFIFTTFITSSQHIQISEIKILFIYLQTIKHVNLMDKTIYVMHANICKILANPIRIEIIEILGENEINFTDLQIATGVLKSNLSQHLSLMVNYGILTQRREGTKAFYKLSSKKIALACSIMKEILVENMNKQHEIINQL